MQFIHEHLCQRYSWYDRWHSKEKHKHYHWAILLLVGVAMASIVLTGVSYTLAQSQDLETPPPGRDFYVDPKSGNDTWEGRSPEAPWRSLSRLSSYSFEPGDRIYLKKGAIFYEQLTLNSSGTFGNPILVSSYGQGADPIVSSFEPLTNWVHETGNKYSARVNSKPKAVYEDGILLKQESKSEDFNATGEWYFAGDDQVQVWTFDGQSPYEHEIGFQSRPHGLVIDNQDFITVDGLIFMGSNSDPDASTVLIKDSNYVTLKNNVVLAAEKTGMLLLNTRNVRVEANDFHDNSQVALSEVSYALSGQNNLNPSIVKNKFTKNSSNGAHLDHTVNGSVADNIFTENLGTPLTLSQAALTSVSGNKITGNGTDGALAYGLAIENSLGSNTVSKNLIAGQLGKAGMLLDAAQDSKVYANILYGNQDSIVIVRSSVGLDVQHNTFYGLGASLSQNGLVVSGSRDLTIRNNIIFDALQYAFVTDSASTQGLNMDYNDIVGRRGIALWNGTALETLSQFRNISGQGSHSMDFDPRFLSLFEKDFRLASNSPLVDQGSSSPVMFDFVGTAIPQGKGPDIGAYEYYK